MHTQNLRTDPPDALPTLNRIVSELRRLASEYIGDVMLSIQLLALANALADKSSRQSVSDREHGTCRHEPFDVRCVHCTALIVNGRAAPAQWGEPVALTDDEFCEIQAVFQALELIASGNTYANNHDLDGAMQKATIRDAMRHASVTLRRFKPVYFKLTDMWREQRSAAPQPTQPAEGGDAREKCAGCVKRCTNNPPDCYAAVAQTERALTDDAERYRHIKTLISKTRWTGAGYEYEFFLPNKHRFENLDFVIDEARRTPTAAQPASRGRHPEAKL
ncbi:hypothetical protein [Paraburkholderia domus]|uniref:hypothetical protein n=1 Tax=Paraburkholderia domus TaxID=2793075 RepID=UPI0019115825|nr:hypothetical protein [Paraburkholderia domus]MBK5064847.1 hypothetical protein [Burkholderia sp. R-70199]CAE6967567.1 hypothetical protein R70199_07860 [Paraburkholderia domus]